MKFLFIICGSLWLMFGTMFLAINASIVHAPENILTIRNIAYIVIGLYLATGAYFVKTGYGERRKTIHRHCNNTFYKTMFRFKFKISINDFCSFYDIDTRDGNEYINSRVKISDGLLEFKDNGLIIFKKFNSKK